MGRSWDYQFQYCSRKWENIIDFSFITSSYHAEHVPIKWFVFLAAAVVGLERTFYQVSEDVGVVEVCAIVYSPEIDCPIAFPFDVRLRTLNGSAGKERDKNHN